MGRKSVQYLYVLMILFIFAKKLEKLINIYNKPNKNVDYEQNEITHCPAGDAGCR